VGFPQIGNRGVPVSFVSLFVRGVVFFLFRWGIFFPVFPIRHRLISPTSLAFQRPFLCQGEPPLGRGFCFSFFFYLLADFPFLPAFLKPLSCLFLGPVKRFSDCLRGSIWKQAQPVFREFKGAFFFAGAYIGGPQNKKYTLSFFFGRGTTKNTCQGLAWLIDFLLGGVERGGIVAGGNTKPFTFFKNSQKFEWWKFTPKTSPVCPGLSASFSNCTNPFPPPASVVKGNVLLQRSLLTIAGAP